MLPDISSSSASVWNRRFTISLTLLAWITIIGVVLWLVAHLIGTLIIFAIATLLAYALYPAVRFFQRYLPRGWAIAVVYLIVLGGLSAVLYILIYTATNQVRELANYVQDILEGVRPNPFRPIMDVLTGIGVTQAQLADATRQLVGQLQGLTNNILPILSRVFNIFLNIFVVAALSIYVLVEGSRVTNWLRVNTPLQQRSGINFLLDTFKKVAGGYIRGQLLLSAILSTITGIVMALLGVPYAVFLGVLAFVLSFIPVIGALVTGVVCILLALTQGWIIAVIALAFLIVMQILEGQILGPRILGSAVGLHPIVSLFALLAGGELFGLVGALFASLGAGIIQALIIAAWTTWRESYPQHFDMVQKDGTLQQISEPRGERASPGNDEEIGDSQT